ncbi:MAG: beta-1,6-N-acetylglucosaminyltransferase [Bacilli bacterium]
MKYAIIMTVHNNPMQVRRLCKTLENPNCYFFIHVDKKTNIKEFEDILRDVQNLQIISKYKVYWAGISQVDATIELLKEALNYDIGYIFFISGQDYFIKTDNYLMKYVNKNKNYMEYQKLPYKKWGTDGRCNRYKYYHNILNSSNLINFNPRNKIYKLINRILIKIQKVFKIERKFIDKHIPYSGANWFNINKQCAIYVVDNYYKYRKYFKYVQFPDELCIQTMVLNSMYKKDTINDTLRYIDWETGPEEPRILTIQDYNKIINSNAIFARKFNDKKDKEILDKLDLYHCEK